MSADMKAANLSGRLTDANYEYFWGCQLTTDKPAVSWSVDQEDGDRDFLTHTLFLKNAVLGPKAVKGERNLVQVETTNFDGDSCSQPLFSLTLGLNDCCFLDVSFGDRLPVTFRLIEGTGPVCITAQHLTEASVEEGVDELYRTTEVNTEDEEESPLKMAKKRKAGTQKAAKAKKGKLDASIGDDGSEEESMDEEDDDDLDEDDDEDDEDEYEDEDEEEEESPPKKSKAKSQKSAKNKANGAKAKKPVKSANGKQAAKKGKKAKA